MVKSIYDLELHESVVIENVFLITRIPGGWIYEGVQEPYASVFVPFVEKDKINSHSDLLFSTDEIGIAADNMQRYGGGFMSKLGILLTKADWVNLNKLVSVFSKEITEYLNLVKR